MNLLKELNNANESVIYNLKQEKVDLEDLVGLISFMKLVEDAEVIGVKTNKSKDTFVVLKSTNINTVNISLRNQFSKQQYPNVLLTLGRKFEKVDDGVIRSINETMIIEDIHAITKRVGNGEILIEAVLRFAKEHQFQTIEGRITDDDKKATPGLPRFYKEMGFTLNKSESFFQMKL